MQAPPGPWLLRDALEHIEEHEGHAMLRGDATRPLVR